MPGVGSWRPIHRRALVLNQNYEPLNVCSVRRAVVLVFRGKAEVLEIGDEQLRGVGDARYDTPSVESASSTLCGDRCPSRG